MDIYMYIYIYSEVCDQNVCDQGDGERVLQI